jgi:hypothetical protein
LHGAPTTQYLLQDFPGTGSNVTIQWEQGAQNFAIVGTGSGSSSEGDASQPSTPSSPAAVKVGALENPGPGSSQSGIGLFSGWFCDANQIDISVDGGAPIQAAYGTPRSDTVSVCGDANNGFGLLFNFNLFGPGQHTAVALADGVAFGSASFNVTTFGVNFLRGANTDTYILPDFPQSGDTTTVQWQQAEQNFAIVGTNTSADTTSQVRFLNLLQCGGSNIDATLQANGFTWDSFTGTPSPYQTVGLATLGPFTVSGPPCPELFFNETFTIPAGENVEIDFGTDPGTGNPALAAFDLGSNAASAAQGAPLKILPR